MRDTERVYYRLTNEPQIVPDLVPIPGMTKTDIFYALRILEARGRCIRKPNGYVLAEPEETWGDV